MPCPDTSAQIVFRQLLYLQSSVGQTFSRLLRSQCASNKQHEWTRYCYTIDLIRSGVRRTCATVATCCFTHSMCSVFFELPSLSPAFYPSNQISFRVLGLFDEYAHNLCLTCLVQLMKLPFFYWLLYAQASFSNKSDLICDERSRSFARNASCTCQQNGTFSLAKNSNKTHCPPKTVHFLG